MLNPEWYKPLGIPPAFLERNMSMRYKSIKLVNYIGIYNGMKLNSIYIDFTKARHGLIVIKGDNGSGKSTLFRAINILNDDSSMFIPQMSAKKVIEVTNDGIDYKIEYIHEFRNGGYTTKGYFYKGVGDNLELCNTNGNITACKDLIFNEFNLDSNFASLAELSSKDRGLVSKIPSMRKQNFNNIITGVEAFNQIYKTLSKRSSVFKSMVNSLTNKIRAIGDEEFLKSSLISIDQRRSTLEAVKEDLIAVIAKDENLISILDHDGKLQDSYYDLENKLQESIKLKQSKYRTISSIMNMDSSITPDPKLVASLEASIERAAIDRVDRQNTITRLLKMNDESAAKLNEKKAKMQSLTSESNYTTLKRMKSDLEQRIKEAEAFFTEAGIEDRSMSSNEYVIGLETLVDIKVIVDTLRDSVDMSVIQQAVQSIILNGNTVLSANYPDIETMRDQHDNLVEINKQLSYDLVEYNSLLKVASKLENRPKDCSISTCYFISDAVKAMEKDPAGNIDRISSEIEDNNLTISNLERSIQEAVQLTETINRLTQICRYIDSRKNILSKLPNGYIFSNTNEFFARLLNGSTFEEISEIYSYISQASMFEQYRSSIEQLVSVNNDIKIYEAKNELIEEIVSDIDRLDKSIKDTMDEIYKCNSDIAAIDISVEAYQTRLSKVKQLIELDTSVKELDTNIESINSTLMTMKDSMNKIIVSSNNIQNNTAKLNNIRTQIKALDKDANQIEFSIKQLAEYKAELEEFNAKYEKVEFMKTCSSPTKGIQLIFIELYLRDIIRTANELLSMVMGGEFKLLKPVIDDRSFNFPCVGDGLPHDDISSLSDGQSAIMSVVLSASIMFHSSTKYNVLKFDEVDGQLDTVNRSQFLYTVERVRQILNCEQSIIITHNNELDLRNADLIILRNSDDDLYNCGGNIIYQYN